MRQVKLNLDEQIDAKLITELEKFANGGPMSKALYLFVYDLWHFRAYSGHIPTQDDPIQGQDSTESGPAGLAESLKEIEEGWE